MAHRVQNNRSALVVQREGAAVRVLVALRLPLRGGAHEEVRLGGELRLAEDSVAAEQLGWAAGRAVHSQRRVGLH